MTLSNNQTVTLNKENGWTGTISNLPKYDSTGAEINYTWTEGTMPEGYRQTGSSKDGTTTTITNSYTAPTTSATVVKSWNDNNNAANRRPASLEMKLSNNQTVTLTAENQWTGTIDNLPKYANGKEIAYTWTEVEMPLGYRLTNTEKNGTVTTLTNTYVSYQVIYRYTGTVPAGAPQLPETRNYPAGETVTVADAPTMEGYVFSGWSRQGSFEMPEHDVVIEGSWSPSDGTKYVVKHWLQTVDRTGYYQDQSIAADQNKTGVTGAQTEAAAYDLTGFTAQAFSQKTIAADGSTVVDIYYNRNPHIVTYEYEGDIPDNAPEVPETESYYFGEDVPDAPIPELPGYTFEGWKDEPDTMPDEDVVVTGKWVPNTDTVYRVEHYLQSLNSNVFLLADSENHTGTTGATATGTPNSYEGYTFDPTVVGTKLSGIIAGDGSLVLRLYYVRNTHTVTYIYEGDVPTDAPDVPETKSYEYGDEVPDAPVPELPGYTFVGWEDEPDIMPDEDVVVRGHWEVNSYTVTYVYDGTVPAGAPALPETKTYRYNDPVPAETVPSLVGYSFDGWNGEVTVMPAHDVIVHGSWAIEKYPVTYIYEGEVPEGAPAVPATVEYEYGSNVPAAPVPSLDGYRFVGWNGEVGTMPAHAVTVTGRWEPVTKPEDVRYTVTYVYLGNVPENAPAVPASAAYAAGDAVPAAEVPSLDGYTFIGWDGEVSTMPAQNVTVTGRWVKQTHTVTIIYRDAVTGEEIHERVTLENLPVGENFRVDNPEIEGYVTLREFVSGTVGNSDIVITVIYVPTAPAPDEGEPSGEGEEPDGEEGTPTLPAPIYRLVDIEDLETPLGLGGLNLNVGECIE